MLSAYLDESGTNKQCPVTCVAGLLYEKEDAKRLNRAWKKSLNDAAVKFFHTVEYAHLRGQFKDRDRASSNALYHQLIAHIKKHVSGGVAVISLPEEDYTKCVENSGFYWPHSQYTTCAHVCMLDLRRIARRLRQPQDIDFMIESGHKNSGELKNFTREVLRRGLPGSYHFHDKRALPLLQTADVWAYEMTKLVKDRVNQAKRPMRKSLEILIDGNPNMRIVELGADRYRTMFEHVTLHMLSA